MSQVRFEFTIESIDQDHLVLLIRVPASRDDVLNALTDRAIAAIGEAQE